MHRLDRFVDTSLKRMNLLYLILFGLLIWTVIVHFLIGVSLWSIHDETALFAFLNRKILNASYIATVTLRMMSLNGNVFSYGLVLLTSLHFYEIVLLVLTVIGFCKNEYKGYRKGLLMVVVIQVIMVGLFAIVGMNAMQMVTLNTSIHFLNIMGMILMIGCLVSLGLLVAMMYHIVVVTYPKAMEVKVVLVE